MHLHKNSIYCYLVFIFLFGFSYKSFSQTNTSVTNDLLSINKKVISGLTIPNVIPCNIVGNLAVEDLFKQSIQYDRRGSWECSKAILQLAQKKEASLSALEKCHFYLTCSEYFTVHQRYDSAKLYATLANTKAGERNWKNEKAHALLLLSSGAFKQRNFSSSYAWADSALVIARQTQDQVLEGQILLQLGLCTRRHFTAAAKRSFPYFIQARDKALAAGDSLTVCAADLYLGVDNFELAKWDEGMPYLKEGIDLSLYSNNFYQVYLTYIAFGYALELGKLPQEALAIYKKSLSLSQHQQLPYNIQHSYHELAVNYQGLHKYDSAIVYANFAGNVAGVDSFWANVWDLKASIYNDMGNYKMATEAYRKSKNWFREDFLYRNQDQLSEYEAKLDTKEKELQVTQQKKTALQLEWMIGGISGLLLISALAFSVQRKAGRKLLLQNNLIQKQRNELQQSLAEKEILLKEIHHRVKNNLTVISSLLELQSNGLSDETAKAAIAVGQNRVSSIALIHQRLYQHENVAAIELNGFLQDLLQQVSGIFKKPGIELKTEINVPETLLDIDTAVPLALIVNELLTNSFKYAFNEKKTGLIKINMQQNNGQFLLTYADNGPGLVGDVNIKNTSSLGLRLIQRLSKQLSGSATYKYEEGSTFIIHFKNSSTRNTEE